MKFLITGANGFIGKSLLAHISSFGHEIIAIVKDSKEDVTEICNIQGVSVVYCNMRDIRSLPNLLPVENIDICIHLAWESSFGKERANAKVQLANIDATITLLEVLKKYEVKRFIGAGTLAEKELLRTHFEDQSLPAPESTYAAAKTSAYLISKTLCTNLNINHTWCYLANTYGVGNSTGNFVNMAMDLMLNGKRASFTSGEQYYDFIYITDVVSALYSVAISGLHNTSYYLGSGSPRKLKYYIEIIRDLIDTNIPLHLGEIPYKGSSLNVDEFDISKLVKDTDYNPQVSFEEGILKTLEWRSNSRKSGYENQICSETSQVVITGACGFIGRYLVNEFVANNIKVIAIDRKQESGFNGPLIKYISCDVYDIKRLSESLSQEKIDSFIHLAWPGSSGPDRKDYNLQISNALNALNCLELASELGCRKFIGAGSIMEYEVENVVHEQGSKPNMNYVYGIGKQLAHSLCKTKAVELDIDLYWPMITNAYGEGEMSPRFINNTIRKILRKDKLSFTAATQTYDFIHVLDVARAILLINEKGKPYHEYVIGSGSPRPLRNFIIELAEVCGAKSDLNFGDIPFTGSNLGVEKFGITPLENHCNFRPNINFSEGVERTKLWLEKTLSQNDEF